MMFTFRNQYLSSLGQDYSVCCEMTKRIPRFVDTGDCSRTWQEQIYTGFNGPFVYDESDVRKIGECMNSRCTYRVCFKHRNSKSWQGVSTYRAQCCYSISLPSGTYPRNEWAAGWARNRINLLVI